MNRFHTSLVVGCSLALFSLDAQAQLTLPYASACDTDSTTWCFGATNSGTGTGVHGYGPLSGVFGESGSIGVYGKASGTFGYGVRGEVTGTNAIGVNGRATGNDGQGVVGEGSNGADGVLGITNGTGDGVQGWSAGSAVAVRGYASAGVAGYFTSTSNQAVYGQSGATGNNPTIWGKATSSNFGVGVKGEAVVGGTAIWGRNPGGTAAWFDGYVYMNGSIVLTSDARLKKDIRDLSYGTSDLMKLHPVTFRWKSGDDIKHVGLIAQEVEKVIPEIVTKTRGPSSEEDTLAVNYSELVPLLIKTVQEQNARIATLERERTPGRLSSLYGIGGATAIGLLPLGLVVAARRRKATTTKSA